MAAVDLPILNSKRTCTVDECNAKWFRSKLLWLDDNNGVFYTKDSRRYYVHDQVLALATKHGTKPFPPGGRKQFERFLRARADPDVLVYCLS